MYNTHNPDKVRKNRIFLHPGNRKVGICLTARRSDGRLYIYKIISMVWTVIDAKTG